MKPHQALLIALGWERLWNKPDQVVQEQHALADGVFL
jgi:hypothetical protein